MKFLHPVNQEDLLAALQCMTGKSHCIAGCTDFLLQKEDSLRDADVLLDLTGCDELHQIRFDGAGLNIGATCTHAQIASHPQIRESYPALAMACGNVGSAQIRNRGTIGGSIANAAPAGDIYPCLLIYGAIIEVLSGTRGETRLVSAEEFLSEEGNPNLNTGEIITAIQLPMPETGTKAAFAKLGERKHVTISKINMAGLLTLHDGKPFCLKLAMGAIGARAHAILVSEDALTTPENFAEYCSDIVYNAIKERASAGYKSIAVKGLAMDLYNLLRNEQTSV